MQLFKAKVVHFVQRGDSGIATVLAAVDGGEVCGQVPVVRGLDVQRGQWVEVAVSVREQDGRLVASMRVVREWQS
jgi:hypothetical protein